MTLVCKAKLWPSVPISALMTDRVTDLTHAIGTRPTTPISPIAICVANARTTYRTGRNASCNTQISMDTATRKRSNRLFAACDSFANSCGRVETRRCSRAHTATGMAWVSQKYNSVKVGGKASRVQ